MKPSFRFWFLHRFLDLPAATGDPDARWEPFQVEHLNNPSLLGITRKARQIGWSWLAAAEAVADAVLAPRSTSIFVSINQDEAKEKIRYAHAVIQGLRDAARPRLVIANQTEIELANGSRLISHPCRPVRGKAKATVYLDEFAHYPKDREIYTAALPVTTKGGQLRIGSSPLGAGGLFWEIASQTLRPYPGYVRQFVPWWMVGALCRDVAGAGQLAPHMLTEERVRAFGSPRLVEIFDNLPLDDFQQEYECAWVDESVAWITWDEIKRNQVDAQAGRLLCWQARSVDEALRAIDEAALASREARIEGVLAGGMDVGRRRNATEMYFVGRGTTRQLPLRLAITLSNVEFDDQLAVASKAMDCLPVSQFLIDQNGLGMQIAEKLHARHGGRAEGVDFTNASKAVWSVELKVAMQRGDVPIPLDRELSYQIHSIKKQVTAAKNTIFDAEASEKHHADKYWALALAVWAARGGRGRAGEYGANPVGGYRG